MGAVKSRKSELNDVVLLVEQAREGELAAFDHLMFRYQNMAVAYAASLLDDADLAQDAALAAFVQAHKDLATLRDPSAFSTWLRKLIWKQCDRIRRVKHVPQVTWELAAEVASPIAGPEQILLRREIHAEVSRAVARLPHGERVVVLLFYGGDYSHHEIASFLGITDTAVKSRLFSARKRLKERLLTILHNDLWDKRPSTSEAFLVRVRKEINVAHAEIVKGDTNEALVRASFPKARYRDPHPIFRLTNSLIRQALEQGVYDIHLVPEGNELSVRLVTESGVKRMVLLPETLRDAVIARFKDGADMDTANTTTGQSGTTSVYNSFDKRLYIMDVRSFVTMDGEHMELHLSSSPSAA